MQPILPRPKTPGEVDALIEAWHSGLGGGTELHEFLGWTRDEYADWVMTARIPGVQRRERATSW